MIWKPPEADLPTIVRVGSLDSDYFNVDFSNGHTILLGLGDLIEEPAFAKLIEARLFDRPQTDGKRLYWVDGPSFTVAEIFAMLAARKE